MNKKGFTLVEVLTVIVLLSLILGIAVPNITKASKKAKERTLLTKVKNIEKAAVLYGQDHREDFNKSGGCYIESNHYDECMKIITVDDLIKEDTNEKKYINADDESGNIINPTDKDKTLNNCQIQIYKKYGKIYAVYLNKEKDTNCWVQS